MAFWRPTTMDTWNPLKKAFWTLGNLFGKSQFEITFELRQQQLRQQQLFEQRLQERLDEAQEAISKIHVNVDDEPLCFCDPISLEMMDDAVVTPSGTVADRETLKKWLNLSENNGDPLTRAPLKIEQVKSFPQLNTLLHQYKTEKAQLLQLREARLQEERDRVAAARDSVNHAPTVKVSFVNQILYIPAAATLMCWKAMSYITQTTCHTILSCNPLSFFSGSKPLETTVSDARLLAMPG